MTPLDFSSTYSFEDSETFADASRARIGKGYVYTRWANPTIDAFQAAVADLEGAPAAQAFSTGMAAISAMFLGLCGPGDRIVSTRQLYGNSFSFLRDRLPRYGVETTFCDADDHDGIEAALDGAKLLYCETIGNPIVKVADLRAFGRLAQDASVPLVVDNTFASPVLCRPIEHGASLVVHSATKFIGGHHDLMGGIVCGPEEMLADIRRFGRDMGGTLAPFNAWLALRGLQTLHVRVERSSQSALAVAHALSASPHVNSVHYPGLPSSPDFDLATSLLGGMGGGTLAFDVAGGRDRAARFQDELRLVERAASLGGTHSLLVHAASVTHTQLDARGLAEAGISEGVCRLSIGLEDATDLIDDLSRALELSG